MLAVACFAAAIGAQAAGVAPPPTVSLVAFVGLVMLFFALRGMYAPRIRPELLENLRGVVAATSLAAMTVLTLRELFGEPVDLAPQTIRPWAFATAYVVAGRIALHWSHAAGAPAGRGDAPDADRRRRACGPARWRSGCWRIRSSGLKPIGFLDKEPMDALDGAVTVPVLGASWDLDDVIVEHDVEQVIVTFSTAPNEVLLRLVRRCEELGVSVSFVPRLFEQVNGRVSVEHIGGLPLVSARPAEPAWLAVRGQVRRRPRRRDARLARAAARAGRAAVAILDLARPADLLPPGPGRPRRAPLRDAQVPLDARAGRRRAGGRARARARHRARRRRGRRPAHARRRVPAAHVARRAAAAAQRRSRAR